MLKPEVGPLVALIGDLDKWIAFAEKARAAHVEDAKSTYTDARTILIVLAIALALLSAAAVLFITRSVTRPVHRLRAPGQPQRRRPREPRGRPGRRRGRRLHAPRAGRHGPVEVEGRDELGELSEVFDEMIDKARRGVAGYDAMCARLGEMIGEVATTAATVSTASERMANTSDETGHAVHEIASAVGDVAQGTGPTTSRWLGRGGSLRGFSYAPTA